MSGSGAGAGKGGPNGPNSEIPTSSPPNQSNPDVKTDASRIRRGSSSEQITEAGEAARILANEHFNIPASGHSQNNLLEIKEQSHKSAGYSFVQKIETASGSKLLTQRDGELVIFDGKGHIHPFERPTRITPDTITQSRQEQKQIKQQGIESKIPDKEAVSRIPNTQDFPLKPEAKGNKVDIDHQALTLPATPAVSRTEGTTPKTVTEVKLDNPGPIKAVPQEIPARHVMQDVIRHLPKDPAETPHYLSQWRDKLSLDQQIQLANTLARKRLVDQETLSNIFPARERPVTVVSSQAEKPLAKPPMVPQLEKPPTSKPEIASLPLLDRISKKVPAELEIRNELPNNVRFGRVTLPEGTDVRDLRLLLRSHERTPEQRDVRTRDFLIDTITRIQQGKLDLQDNRPNRLQELIKDLGQERLAIFKQLLLDTPPRLISQLDMRFDATLQPKVREILTTAKDICVRHLESPRDTGAGHRPASDRLLDFIRINAQQIDKSPTSDTSRALVTELRNILKDCNRELVLDPHKGSLTLKDLVGKNPEVSIKQILTNPLLVQDNVSKGDRITFPVKGHAGEDVTLRIFIERLESRVTRIENDLCGRRTETVNLEPAVAKPLAQHLGERTQQVHINNPEPIVSKAEIAGINTGLGQHQIGIAGSKGETKLEPELIATISKTDLTPTKTDSHGPAGNEEEPKEQSLAAYNNELSELDSYTEKTTNADQENSEEDTLNRREDALIAAALLAKELKDKKDKEQKEKAQEKDRRVPERRIRYVVKEGDTLESIAERMLHDKRLADLIYEINKAIIPTGKVSGKQAPLLKPKMVIYLPITSEIKDYRKRSLGTESSNTDSDPCNLNPELENRIPQHLANTQEAATRRANIESLLGPLRSRSKTGQLKYVIRLGDTLQNIALKHPALNDIALWQLLAEKNKIPIRVDEKGKPIVVLKRGSTLTLPTKEEISAFYEREAQQQTSTRITPTLGTGHTAFQMPTVSCPECNRTTIASATICPGCSHLFKKPLAQHTEHSLSSNGEEDIVSTVLMAAAGYQGVNNDRVATNQLNTSTKSNTLPDVDDTLTTKAIIPAQTPEDNSIKTFIEQLGETTRLIRSGRTDRLQAGFKLRLEAHSQNTWAPVICYEIYEDVSLRHEFTLNGERKTIRIDLPPSAALELAENDLASTWQSYCSKFLAAQNQPK